SEMTKTVEISGEGGPLGIHVVPFFSSLSGRMLGLFIRGIEENSRSRRDDLFHENECIVKINHVDLTDKTFAQAQDIFRQAMKFQSVILEVLPPYNREQYEKSAIAPLCILNNEEGVTKTKIPPPLHPKPAVKAINISGAILESGVQGTLQQAKSPNLPRLGRKPSSPSLSPLMGFGNKRNAKKIKIDLKKGPEGLGFTVVTRDSSVHGPGPIFVKNILPKGAAVKDGRLQSGDRILEVNGRDITGRTQEELVAMLRSTKQGETVCLIVARQEEAFLPRELKGEPNCSIFSPETTEQLTFEIPLNDSGSAGLGVSLKGNKSRETGADLGIFIKSVIHGGAAFKDGRLRVNDQLVAVNGESLLGKSNHEAMETLRRSMSMEGNIRGRIQLVVLRRLEVHAEERADQGVFQKSAFDGNHNFAAASRRSDTILQQFVTCSPREGIKGKFPVSDHGNGENETPPPLPPHPSEDLLNEDYNHSPIINSAVHLTDQHISFRSLTPAKQSESINLKASKSMDLGKKGWVLQRSYSDGDNDSSGKDFGPTLGLKKSSSLESLQTAVAEVRKNELPFHRPRPHVVRGRGCNESFRAAIDKSYDGPEDGEEDGGSDKSSHCGQEAQNVESALPGNSEIEDGEIKAKKDKKSREKEKKKGKSKIKEKKKKEENEDPEKKKKKGFGVMLRFGKKKEDKSGKADQKGTPKQGMLKEEELEKMKDERERIGAKHQELRQKQLRGLSDYSTGPGGPDIDDDEMDPNYARVNHFREAYPPGSIYRPSSPAVGENFVYLRDSSSAPMEREHLEGLYAKINKQHYPQTSGDSGGNADRIQRLRKEYHQARREGLPFYEDDEGRAQLSDYDQHWVPGKGPDGSSYNLHFEGVERQYASLPRRGPAEPLEYLTGPRVTYKERDLPYYHGGQPVIHPSKGNYIRAPDTRVAELRYPQYYAAQPITNQHKGPLRQDVPPSPPQSHRAPAYNEMVRHRGTSPDQYQYRQQDPRQKNPMTAAV
ncbi:PAR3L protein, partial [Promerops cafer]|nr:PAR3L protein [Promerops cafer]